MAVNRNQLVEDYKLRLAEARGLFLDGSEALGLEKLKEVVCMCGGEVPCRKGMDFVDLPNGPSVFTKVWYDHQAEVLKADYHSDWDDDRRFRTIDLDDCPWAAGKVVPFMEDASFLNERAKDIARDYPFRYVRLDREDFFGNGRFEEPFAKVHNKIVSVCGTAGFRYGWSSGSDGREDPFVSFGSGSDLQVRGVGRGGLYVVSDRDGRVGLHDAATFALMYDKGLGRSCRLSSFMKAEMKVTDVKGLRKMVHNKM